MSRLISIWLLFIGGIVQAQIPQVPSKMELADMKLIITDGAKKDIQKDVDMLRSSDKYFKIKLDRVVLYMPTVERILKEENIPDDIKYLAIQESAFIPDAVSSSKAVGFWQFKDGTAREVGMRVDNKVDERKNIVSSTHGAARYFRSHQKQLDNWAHTVTAHMTGGSGIKKYVDAKDYGAKKMTITKKTHWYLKRFLAHKIAFQDELKYRNSEGMELVEYNKGTGKDLRRISKEFKVEEAELQAYNKWLIHGRIPGDRRYVVMVPVKKGNRKARELAQSDKSPNRKTVEEPRPQNPSGTNVAYPKAEGDSFVKSDGPFIRINGVKAVIAGQGDDFGAILEKTGLRAKKLLKYNDLSSNPAVKSGDIFFVKRKKKGSSMGFYVVRSGESTWEVSQKFGIRLKDLLKKNRMDVREVPEKGRVMWLDEIRPARVPVEYREVRAVPKPEVTDVRPIEKEPTPAPEEIEEEAPEPIRTTPENTHKKTDATDRRDFIRHTVQPGETLWKISRRYSVSVDELLRWNDMKAGASLAIGQQLLVKGDEPAASPEPQPEKAPEPEPKPEVSKRHVVRGGETLYGIARQYQVTVAQIRQWNNLDQNASLSIGQELSIKGGASAKQPVKTPVQAHQQKTKVHTVQAGDTLYSIARKYGMEVDALKKLNNKTDNSLALGEQLKVNQ